MNRLDELALDVTVDITLGGGDFLMILRVLFLEAWGCPLLLLYIVQPPAPIPPGVPLCMTC